MSYDFSQLNDKEFESLAVDLLGKHLSQKIERFKSGKDSGIDGRFFSGDDSEVILQCKHYLSTGFSGLMSNLKRSELPKVTILAPRRYIFITSLPLSRKNKKDIKDLFSPFIRRPDDVFSQEDLNQLLLEYPKIEERYFKLWISSSNILQRMLNNAIKGRSDFAIKSIRDKSKKYIQTNNHIKAIETLKKKNVVIVSGEPGIGKTTLAENLCLYFVSHGYEFVDIQEDINEAENVYKIDEKQIFYYDDFLGSNYLEAVENKKDSHIVRLIERIKEDKKKLFILTSRTNILNSGVMHSCIFVNGKIKKNEYLLTINSFSALEKAKILYNHIWHSKLSNDFIEELYKDKRYRKIINHRNFNPRLIEFITDSDRVTVDSSERYWDFVLKTLDNPRDIWDDCFKRQNNAYVRCIVLLVVFNGGSIKEEDLRPAYDKLIRLEKLRNNSHTEKDFKSIAQLATKIFLNRRIGFDSLCYYTLFNPSVSDYILKEYCGDISKLICIYASLQTVSSLNQINALEQEGILTAKICTRLKRKLFELAEVDNCSYDYLISIAYHFTSLKSENQKIIDILQHIIENPYEISYFSRFIMLVDQNFHELNLKSFKFLPELISKNIMLDCEIKEFAMFIKKFSISEPEVLGAFQNELQIFLCEEISATKNEIDFEQCIRHIMGYGGDPDIEVNEELVAEKLTVLAETILEDLDLPIVTDINIEEAIETIDIEDLVSSYINSYEPDYDGHILSSSNVSSQDDIDDLFQRT